MWTVHFSSMAKSTVASTTTICSTRFASGITHNHHHKPAPEYQCCSWRRPSFHRRKQRRYQRSFSQLAGCRDSIPHSNMEGSPSHQQKTQLSCLGIHCQTTKQAIKRTGAYVHLHSIPMQSENRESRGRIQTCKWSQQQKWERSRNVHLLRRFKWNPGLPCQNYAKNCRWMQFRRRCGK